MNSEEYIEDVLDNMNNCESTCTGLMPTGEKVVVKDIDWLIENLPGMDYVLDRMVNYVFSNGLTTGDAGEADERLDRWLYEDMNLQGATNYSTLREAIKSAAMVGSCGIRLYEGNLYLVKKGYFGILHQKKDGIEEIVAYFIKKDMSKTEDDIDLEEWQTFSEYIDIEKWFDEKGYILLDGSEFVNIRNDTSQFYGKSPLEHDKQRINLILSVYRRLNYDIKYDGPGRIILHTKDGYVSDEKNEVSTSEVLNNTPIAKSERYKDALDEAKRIAKDLRDSTSDSVGVMSGAFEKEITHLPRVTKATEFLEWLNVDMVVMAQLVGMSPTLLEVGEFHGNVSVEKVIDNAMLNTVIPLREKYAIQFSDLVAKVVGAAKVFFNKYDMIQTRDENELRGKIADIIKTLSYSYKAVDNEELQNGIKKSIETCSEVLEGSLRDREGNVRSL